MKLSELPNDFTPEQFMALDKEELDTVPYDTVKWQCKVKLCKHFTRMRDYSLRGETGRRLFFHKRFGWIDTYKNYFICAKHWKLYKGRAEEDIPLKRLKNGHLPWGGDSTETEEILY